MSAGGSGVIGPVSVRYAAQIRELLFAQAMQRMAADQAAARAQADADRSARAETAAKAEQARQPLHARIDTPDPSPFTFGRAAEETGTVAPAKLVDIQA